GRWIAAVASPVLGFVPARHDADAVLVHEGSAWDVRSLRRHRVGASFERDGGGRPDEDRNADGQSFRSQAHRAQARELLLPPCFRNLSRRATRSLEVHLAHPRRELLLEARLVDELAPLEEGVLDPLDQVLDRAFLVAAPRRAHLRADAELEHHLRERGVELLDLATATALRHDGARPVEHGEKGNAAERRKVANESADERLDLLVRHDAHRDEAGVLQPRREEVDALLATVD